jgi:Tol biopolymer transport system component
MGLPAGTRLGPYEITASLGAGGMGEVYRARDTRLDRDVAIKALPPDFATDQDRVMRFEREAKTLAALNHPNVAQIHGMEHGPTGAVLIMELVEGDDLSARIRAGALPLDEALAIAREVCDAIEAAHEAGIVHRDLKPANIKVRHDGTVKVLDFGLARPTTARPLSDSLANSPTLTSPGVTHAGVILGTAAYMSPEQARGKVVDKRADIWAFGCVLYEMLAGRALFARDDLTLTLAAIVHDEPDWRALPAATPPTVRALLARCLERDPKRRLRDMGEARLLLEPGAIAASVAPARPAGARGLLVPLAMLAIGIVAGGVAVGWMSGGSRVPAVPAPRVEFAIPSPEGTSLMPFASPSLSPDGTAVAFTAPRFGTQSVWVHTFADGQSRELAGSSQGARPFWSPDGRFVAFFAGPSLKRVAVSGGPVETMARVDDIDLEGVGGTWGADGTLVFSANLRSGIRRVRPDGGDVERLTTPDASRGEVAHAWPRFVPGSGALVYTVQTSAPPARALHLRRPDGSTTPLLPDVSSSAVPSLANLLLFPQGRALVGRVFDLGRLELVGEPFVVADNLSVYDTGNTYDVAGRVTAFVDFARHTDVAWYGRSGRRIAATPVGDRANWTDIAPDGRRFVVDIENEESGARELWVVDGDRRTRITHGVPENSDAVWSPDGTRVAFALSGRELHEHRVGQSGSRVLRTFGVSNNHVYPTHWSRDGQWIAYVSWFKDANDDIWMVRADGQGSPVPLVSTPFNEGQARFSPDGRFFAYTSNESGRAEVYVQAMPPRTERWLVSTNGGAQPMWRGDGRELYFLGPDFWITAVPVTLGDAVTVGAAERLFPVTIKESPFFAVRNHYAVSPDGQRFLVNSVTGGHTIRVVGGLAP